VFRDDVLDHRVKELARVFIARSLECGYCAGQRSDLGAAQGLTERAYDEVLDFRRPALLTAREKAALRWAEAIARDRGWLMMTCGSSCTAISPSRNWSSWVISSARRWDSSGS
jgi:alkylhydroperoxidase family enzyme